MKKTPFFYFFTLCLLMIAISKSAGDVLDYECRATDRNFAVAEFRFWCPEQLKNARGVLVIVPGHDGDGRRDVEDTEWQAFATEHGLVLVACHFKDKPHAANSFIESYSQACNGSGQALIEALGAFAKLSKHDEIAYAPLLLWGHSAGGQFNYEFTCWKPERVLGFVVNKGGVYFTHLAPEAARHVPGIFFTGKKDLEFRRMSLCGVYAMNRRAHALWTLAEEPDSGHECGKTREMAIVFFSAILPLRQPSPTSMQIVELNEDSGWIGDLKSYETRKGKMKEDEWSAWLPTESVAQAWGTFVKGK